jgi:hypothetical protein
MRSHVFSSSVSRTSSQMSRFVQLTCNLLICSSKNHWTDNGLEAAATTELPRCRP